ncbi:hypothetical protein ABIB95_005312 [Bradyrhizobium sp. LA2.1]
MVSLSERQRKVLEVLAGCNENEGVLFFSHIATWSGLPLREARLATRALKRKGLAEQTSCWDDDGCVRGSGYICTQAGRALISAAVGGSRE